MKLCDRYGSGDDDGENDDWDESFGRSRCIQLPSLRISEVSLRGEPFESTRPSVINLRTVMVS